MIEKEKILSKLNIKDYRNELEVILENKKFDEEAKSLILNIYYKLDNFYKDYLCVKKNCETKIEFIEKYISIIKDRCNIIEILFPKECTKGKKYIIDSDKGVIKTFPNEVVLLYAIFELEEKFFENKLTDDIYIENNEETVSVEFIKFLNKCVIEFIKKGKIINSTEPIRDFNGWSWNIEIEDFDEYIFNLVFQNLLIIYGYNEIYKISENNDVIDFLKNNHLNAYDKNSSEFIRILVKLCVEVFDNSSIVNHTICVDLNENLINISNDFNNKGKYINVKSKDNKILIGNIERIDKILNDINLIRVEYKKKIAMGEKHYIGISEFVESLETKRTELLNEINNNNKLLNPGEYFKNRDKLKKLICLFENINSDNKNQIIFLDMINLQKCFLEMLKDRIIKISVKKDLYSFAIQLRYYLNLLDKENNNILNNEKLIPLYEDVEKILISKMIESKIIDIGFKSEELNYNILKYIFKTKMITLDQLVIKICFIDLNKIEVSYFDGKMLEYKEVFEIPITEEVLGKKDRKVKVFKIGG